MMMGNGGHSRFGKEFSKSNSERNMHRDRETILWDQNVDVEFIDEVINRTFQIIGQSPYSFGYETVPLSIPHIRSLIHLFSEKPKYASGTT